MYTLKLIPRAQKDLDKLENVNFESILKAINSLRENSRPPGCKKLAANEGYRVRVGDYRIIYRIDDETKTIFIYKVKHRKDIYR